MPRILTRKKSGREKSKNTQKTEEANNQVENNGPTSLIFQIADKKGEKMTDFSATIEKNSVARVPTKT